LPPVANHCRWAKIKRWTPLRGVFESHSTSGVVSKGCLRMRFYVPFFLKVSPSKNHIPAVRPVRQGAGIRKLLRINLLIRDSRLTKLLFVNVLKKIRNILTEGR
jgi:hypothetical protein